MKRALQMPPLELLELAAALRVAGKTWDEIGIEVNRSGGRVRHWPRLYAEQWSRCIRGAETQFVAELAIEARRHVRGLMRSKDESIQLSTCRDVLKTRQADRDREFAAEAAATPSDVDPEALAMAKVMLEMTDEQLEEQERQACRECPNSLANQSHALPLVANTTCLAAAAAGSALAEEARD